MTQIGGFVAAGFELQYDVDPRSQSLLDAVHRSITA